HGRRLGRHRAALPECWRRRGVRRRQRLLERAPGSEGLGRHRALLRPARRAGEGPMSFDLVALGECMVELFEDPPGSGTFRRAVGGDTLNALAMASRLGAKTAYLTKLADDPLQDPIRATLKTHGVAD